MTNLIKKKSEISKICSEENIDNIRVREWDLLQEYVNLFKPFNDITNEMSKGFETTISKVCSSILYLKHHLLRQTQIGSELIKYSAEILIKEMEKKFDHFLDPKNEKFSEGIYIASNFLDPRFAGILNEQQRQYAKNFIKSYSQQFNKNIEKITEPEINIENPESLTPFESFMETEFSQTSVETDDNLLDLDKQLINWIHIVGKTKVNLKTDAFFDFWKNDTSIDDLLDLKNIALNILCTPSSTATVERVYSAAGNACIAINHLYRSSFLYIHIVYTLKMTNVSVSKPIHT